MKDRRPNIILIMTDQQRGDCLGVEDHPCLLTPNMDSLAGAGTRFSRAYTTCPSCIPARRSLLSGQFPATNGMPGFVGRVDWDPPATLPGTLSDAGYQTFLVGRSMHQHPPRKRYGYDHMILGSGYVAGDDYDEDLRRQSGAADGFNSHGLPFNGWNARPWHLDERLHPTYWIVDQAMRFLATRDPSCPFFLTVSFYAPHPPLCPPAFYMDRYLRAYLPEPVIGDWAEDPGEVSGINVQAARGVKLDGETWRSAAAGYFGLTNHIDDQIFRLLAARGEAAVDWSNTVVIFTSDHGEMLGDHYMYRKCEPYEGSARIPMLVRGGGDLGFAEGQVVDRPVCLEDLMPTCLDLAGIDTPDHVDGESLAPWLRGEQPGWREYLHSEHAPCYSEQQAYHMLTDGKWKYIWRPTDGSEQLFDLTTDPEERHDAASETVDAAELTAWRARLIEHLKDRPEGFTDGDQLIAGRPYPPLMDHGGTRD